MDSINGLEWEGTDNKGAREKSLITVDYDRKTLYLETGDDAGMRSIIGPYLAMYNYRYRKFRWHNWTLEQEPTLELLQDMTEDKGWEEYVYSLIVNSDATYEQIKDIVESLGYIPDYILRREKGSISVLHQTMDISRLILEGYTLTEDQVECPNYSFGMGLYCLDKSLHDKHGTKWEREPSVYVGHYTGEYLRCIDDTCNDLKSGGMLEYQQEIIIPFNEREILWWIMK